MWGGRRAAIASLLCATSLAGAVALPAGRQARATARRGAVRAGAPAHLAYQWAVRQGEVVVRHEAHVYDNGFVRYARSVGGGTPQEFTLPNDPAFAKRLFAEYEQARRRRRLSRPCGVPQGGRLVVATGRRERRFDLSDEALWARYGRLVRRLLAHLTGGSESAAWGDCQPPVLQVDLQRLGTPRQAASRPAARPPEPELLIRYGLASSEEARLAALQTLALHPSADPVLRQVLLRDFPGTLPARRLLRRHAAVLVREVSGARDARLLLRHLRRVRSVASLYHQAVLLLLLRRFDEAARRWGLFHELLAQDRAAERVRRWLAAVRLAAVDIRRRRPPWRRVRSAPARLFAFWLDRAEAVWTGAPADAPPLARLLYARALHYAAQSVLAPSLRAFGGSARLRARARALVRAYYPVFSRGGWEGYPYWLQRDLLVVAGLLRRTPGAWGSDWVRAHAEPPERVACRMVAMRYFGPAARYVERLSGQAPGRRAPLLLALGRCLARHEQFGAARRVLVKALSLGAAEARAALLNLRADQGDLDGALREAVAARGSGAAGPALLRAHSRVLRLRGQHDAAIAAARAAIAGGGDAEEQTKSWLAYGRAAEAAGRSDEARRAYARAARGGGRPAVTARMRWARLLWRERAFKKALQVAWPLAGHRGARARAAAHALVALAAHRLGLAPLVALEVTRAEAHAGLDPEALAEVSALLLEAGVGMPAVGRLLARAEGKRPGWSRLAALRAWRWARLGRLERAWAAVRAALRVRPGFPPYRLLARAILLARASGGQVSHGGARGAEPAGSHGRASGGGQ